MGYKKVAALYLDNNKEERCNRLNFSQKNCHVSCYPGLHGAITEPQSCCSLVLLAASLHHSLSANKEAASDGVKVPPVDQTCDSEH